MAAILCNGIGSCCECFCTAPCKLCGSSCRGCGTVCSSLCKGLCGSPLSAYVIVTVVTQVPVVIVSAMELVSGISNIFRGDGNGGCKGSGWLLGSLIVAIVHIIVAFYSSYRVTNRTDETLRDNDRHTSWERISYLLCHDPIIAFYILVWLFFIVWLCVGVVWSMQHDMDDDAGSSSSRCGDDVGSRVSTVLGLGWAYFIIAPSVLSCVLCCTCFSKKDYVASDAEFEAKEQAKANYNNNSNNNNNNNNNNSNEDIESPNTSSSPPPPPSTSTPTQSESKENSKASNNSNPSSAAEPRTYSVDGIPIDEVMNDDNRKSSSIHISEKQQAIPDAVAEEIPPPPPATAPHHHSNSMSTPTPTPTPTQTPTPTTSSVEATANAVVDSVTKTVGGWFSGSSSKKQQQQPDVKATVY